MGKVCMSSKVVRSEGLRWKRECNKWGEKNTRNYVQYSTFLP